MLLHFLANTCQTLKIKKGFTLFEFPSEINLTIFSSIHNFGLIIGMTSFIQDLQDEDVALRTDHYCPAPNIFKYVSIFPLLILMKVSMHFVFWSLPWHSQQLLVFTVESRTYEESVVIILLMVSLLFNLLVLCFMYYSFY